MLSSRFSFLLERVGGDATYIFHAFVQIRKERKGKGMKHQEDDNDDDAVKMRSKQLCECAWLVCWFAQSFSFSSLYIL